MRNLFSLALAAAFLFLLPSCSPRDFLTRRLASDLIVRSELFRAPRKFLLRTGVISNSDYLSQDYLALQHHGWISGSNAPCPASVAPPPCWDVALTPSGVDTLRTLVLPGDSDKQTFTIPAARRELVAVSGIAKQGNVADVEFTWRWSPLNEFGAALYPSDARYRSTARFRSYDDGWRIVERLPKAPESLEDSLDNARPVQ